ncbi:MAG: hypothetical protein JO081_03510 [Alphaproteobacteria bacterium]|nr:hypothetical protein [Alphaproteobacteria bacterium]
MLNTKHRRALLGLALSSFFALVQFRLIIMLFGADYGRAVDAAAGVLAGKPHWRTFQARVLGPLLIDRISPLFPSFFDAHVCFSIVTLAVMGYLAWRIGWRVGANLGAAMLALFVFETSFSFLLTPHWLYAWDYLNIIVFLVFVDFVVAGRSWPWFVALWAIGIFSRETAAFIAVWMILEALSRRYFARRPGGGGERLDRGMLIAGIVSLVLGAAIVQAITRALFIEEVGPKIFNDVAGEGGRAFYALRIAKNFDIAIDSLTRFQYDMPFVILIYLGVTLVLAIGIMRADRRRYFAFGLTYIAHIATTLVFGILNETRVFVEQIPLVILGTLVLTRLNGRPERAPGFGIGDDP